MRDFTPHDFCDFGSAECFDPPVVDDIAFHAPLPPSIGSTPRGDIIVADAAAVCIYSIETMDCIAEAMHDGSRDDALRLARVAEDRGGDWPALRAAGFGLP